MGISLDQQLGKVLGVLARFGWQDDQAEVNYDAINSGGVDIIGTVTAMLMKITPVGKETPGRGACRIALDDAGITSTSLRIRTIP